MPSYDLRCRCGIREERVARMADRHSQECAECGSVMDVVPSLGSLYIPRWWKPDAGCPSRAELTEPSGLIEQGERNGW
jgi:hypothetical protein